MKSTDAAVSELSFVFKLLPLLQEVDTIDRLYRLLLAIVTSGRSIGYPRAMILVVDEEGGVIRGRYGIERSPAPGPPSEDGTEKLGSGFDEMARSVFRNFEQIDASDLSVKVRSYAVPLGWHRSALVKALRTTYPVLAHRSLSEFATDTFFDFFGVSSYIAVPVEFDRRVTAVVAVDRSSDEDRGSTDEISVLCSLVQQTAGAAQRLLDISDARRRARILSKMHDSLHRASTPSEFEESLKAVLAMACRAVRGSACFVRNETTKRTTRVEWTNRRGHADGDGIGAVIEEVLSYSAGTLETVGGDGSHPLLKGIPKERLAFFFACPLVVGSEGVGAIAVYTAGNDSPSNLEDFGPKDKTFLDLCSRVLASAIDSRRKLERVGRLEELVQEMGSKLVRERERSRIGERSIDYHLRLGEDLGRLREILSRDERASHLVGASDTVEAMQRYSSAYWDEVLADKSGYVMSDLFDLTRRAVERWRERAEKQGVQLTVRIPERGVSLLLDRDRVTSALERVLAATLSCLAGGDKLLVECLHDEGRAVVCIADDGVGLPGDAVSRLFMPFDEGVSEENERQRALSLAGDILQKHSAEISIKSSPSWKTILVLSFPLAASRDRRERSKDRRRRRERRMKNGTDRG